MRYEIEENGELVQFIFNAQKEAVIEKTNTNLKRLIRSFDLWASECTQEKTWYHYASDEQGSIVFVTDGEEIKNRYEYDAWGNAVVCEEKVENRYRYTGQQYDPVTQQYYLRARYYNPVIARFTQEDEYRGDGLNLYAYCANNPVVYFDPSGYVGESKDVYTGAKKDSGINNHSSKGYNPKPGERTFDGYVKNNVPLDKETTLHTKSPKFNTDPKNADGQFKRFGTDEHGGIAPHVHQPTRNINPKTGEIYGGQGKKTTNGGVTSPNKRDVKQLYDYLNNGKYQK